MACGGRSKAVQDFKICIFIYLGAPDLSIVYDLLVTACRRQFPDQVWNPGPLHQECGVLATRPPEKSPGFYLESCVAFTQISLVSFDVDQVSLQSFAFLSLHQHFLRVQGQLFCGMFLTLDLPVSSCLSVCYLCLKIHLCLFLRPCLQTHLLKMLNCFSVFLKCF